MNGMTEVPVFDSGALESEISHKLLEDSLEEEKRLYYVAFTRARDYLILCTKTKKWPAPEAVNPFLKGLLQYSDGVHQTHFCWDDQPTSILVKTITKHQSVIDAQSDQKQRKIYFPRALGEKTYEPLRKRPSEVQTSPGSITGEIRLIHSAMEIDRTGVRDTDLGDAIHNAFCACSNQLTDRDNLDMIENSLDAFGLGEKLSPEELLNAYQSFFGKFVQPLNPIKVYKELPIQAMMNNQLMSGYIDLVLELENELILVDYKSFSLKEWKKTAFRKKALGFAGQLGMYAEVLEKTMSKKVSEKWIYFVGMGRMVEVC